MKKLLTLLLFLFVAQASQAQQYQQIGTDSTVQSYFYGPLYRSSATSTFNYSSYTYLYLSSELGAIPPGATITGVAWQLQAGTGGLTGANSFEIYAENTSQSTIAVSSNLATEIAMAGMMYSNALYEVPAGGGWQLHTFSTPFTYTGNNLKLSTNHFRGGTASGVINYHYETTPDLAGGAASSTPTTSTTFSTSYSGRRPNIRIYYTLPTGLDMGILAINAPGSPVVAGSNESVEVTLVNSAAIAITSADVSYSINGQAPVTQSFSGNLASGSTALFSFSTPFVVPSSTFSLDVWIANINGQGADINTGNDSLSTTICPAVTGGSFSVGGATSDFATLQAAFDFLSCGGMAGPVVLNVDAAASPLNEQVIVGNIIGSSASNTITVNGNGAVLEYLSTNTSERATLKLNGTSNITVNNMSIKALGSASGEFGYAVHLMNGANNVSFYDCVIEATTESTSISFSAFVTSNSANSATSVGFAAEGLTVANCEIIGGYYGMVVNGPTAAPFVTNNNITNNVIRDFYLYGLYVRGNQFSLFEGNDIQRATRLTVSTFYGIYTASNLEGTVFNANRIHDNSNMVSSSTSAAYPIYITGTTGSATDPVSFTNNAVYNINSNGTTYGAYVVGTSDFLDFYHNSIILDNVNQAGTSSIANFYITSSYTQLNVRNNIFYINNGSSGTHYNFWSSNVVATPISNHNVFGDFSTGGTKVLARLGNTNYATLADWQSHGNSFDMNSVYADPVFASPSTGDVTPLSGNANDVGTPVGVLLDLDGNTRSTTTPDAGAMEFSPLSGDLALVNAEIIRTNTCYSSGEMARLWVVNVLTSTVDLSVNPLLLTYQVAGPFGSSASSSVNSGILNPGDTLVVNLMDVNLSGPGAYTLTAYIGANNANPISTNDTFVASPFDVFPLLSVFQSLTSVVNSSQTVDISASSPFMPTGGEPFITEICQFKTGVGAPNNGWPAYLIADDYIEISWSPGADLGGYTLEQWSATGLTSTYTFPAGTVIGPNGTAVIAVGQLSGSVESPADFYYHGTGTFTGTWSSSAPAGRIIKDPMGAIVDAVGYGVYTFPAAAGTSPADWSGDTPSGASTSGNRLAGPYSKDAANWVNSGTSPQDPNVLNAGVFLPAASSVPGFSWTLNGQLVDTVPSITLGPFTSSGIYTYVANYSSPCGLFQDSVSIDVQISAFNCPVISQPIQVMGGTSCLNDAAMLSASPGLPSAHVVWKDAAGYIRGDGNSFTAPLLTMAADYFAHDAEQAAPAVTTGPSTAITTGGFGNFSNGTYFQAFDHLMIDSMTFRSDGPVLAQVQLWTANPNEDSTASIVNTSVFQLASSGDQTAHIGMYVAPGSYYVNLGFAAGTGLLWRSTDSATYPYVAPGLLSVDSAWVATNNIGNLTRAYYMFDWVVNAVCIGNGVAATADVPSVATIAGNWMEDFETTPVSTVSNSSLSANIGVNQSAGLRRNVYSANFASIQSPIVSSISLGDHFGFDYKITNWSSWTWPGIATTLGAGDTIRIEASSDCGNSYSQIAYISATEHAPFNEFGTVAFSLDSFVGQNLTFRVFFRQTSGIDVFFDVDNMFVGPFTAQGINLVSIDLDPVGNQCAPTDRTLTVNASSSTAIDVSVWRDINGISQAPVALGLAAGTNLNGSWSGVIPAAADGDAVDLYVMITDAGGDTIVELVSSYTDQVLTVDAGADQTIPAGDVATLTATTNAGVSGYLAASTQGGNGSNGVTFNVEALATVQIDTIFVPITSSIGNLSLVDIWMTNTPVNGPPIIDSMTGWFRIVAQAPTFALNAGLSGGALSAPVVIPGGISMTAGDHYGFFVQVSGGTMIYTTHQAGLQDVFSDGNITISTGPTVGYGGGAPNPTFHPRMFNGAVGYSGANVTWNALGSGPNMVTIGTDTLVNTSTTYPAPYGNFYWGARHQILIEASLLVAQGATPGSNITSLAFDVAQAQGEPLQDFTIKMGHTNEFEMFAWQSGMQAVYYAASFTDVNGWNDHQFQTPFTWNGVDNVVVEVCFNNTDYTNNAIMRYSNTPNPTTLYVRRDASGVCADSLITAFDFKRPNMQLGFGGDFVGTGSSINVSPMTTTTYVATAMAGNCMATDTVVVNVAIPNNQITGTVRYANQLGTPLNNSMAHLVDVNSMQVVASEPTGANGEFTMAGFPSGNYVLTATTAKAWGGVNATDALAIGNHFINTLPLAGLNLLAGDVNLSSTVNSTDALLVARRFVNLDSSFVADDWVFEETQIMAMGNGMQNEDVFGLSYGDVNGSYVPNGSRVAPQLAFEFNEQLQLDAQAQSIPVRIGRDLELGALSLVVHLPQGVALKDVRMAFESGNFDYQITGNELRLSWFSTQAISMRENDVLFYLDLAELMKLEGEPAIGGMSEIANGLAEAYPLVNLRMPRLQSAQASSFSANVYPNPAKDLAQLEYSLPEAGKVTIRITDALGRTVYNLVEQQTEAGLQQLPLELNSLAAGRYHVNLLYNRNGEVEQQLLKLQISK